MKTMTCKDMGGMCDTAMTAGTAEEMVAEGMKHIETTHPDMTASIKSMPKDHPEIVAWHEKFMKDWEATPETK